MSGETRRRTGRIAHFGMPGAVRDRLVGAVLRGEKTATTSLLAELESNQEALPAAGERLTVVDSEGESAAVIELLAVEVIKLGDVDQQLARDEGEGFQSVTEWRQSHERFWREEVIPRLPAGVALTDDTEIIVERFRLVNAS